MQIEKRTMNWLPRASAYSEATAARAKRKASNETFMAGQSSLMSTISSVQMNKVTETVNITSRIALARVTKTA